MAVFWPLVDRLHADAKIIGRGLNGLELFDDLRSGDHMESGIKAHFTATVKPPCSPRMDNRQMGMGDRIKERRLDWFWVELLRGSFIAFGVIANAYPWTTS